jgi:cytochrome c-type biogenesis protein CcmH
VRRAAILAALMLATPAGARVPPPPLANLPLQNAAQEADAKALMETIRCLVCAGQSIADSDAAMAADMRAMVRTRIAAGERPEAVRAWLVDRYGREVSYDPPLSAGTAVLWAAPVLMILAGVLIARASFRKRR